MIRKLYHYIKFNLLRNQYPKNNKLSSVIITGKNVTLNNCTLDYNPRVVEYTLIHNSSIGLLYISCDRYFKILHTEIGKYCRRAWETTIKQVSYQLSQILIDSNSDTRFQNHA